MLWILSSATSAGKQDTLFFFFFFFFFRAHWTRHKTRTCETFSLPHIFFGCHLPLQLLCLMVIASLSHQIIQIQPYLTAAATGWHSHTHTQSVHICLAEFRCKMNGSSRITQQNEIMSWTWFHLHEPPKMCVRSGLEVFDFIVLQWTPFSIFMLRH